MSRSGYKGARGRTDHHIKAVGEVLDGIEADGLPGLVKTMFRMIGEDQPSIDCLIEADNNFGSVPAVEDEEGIAGDQAWDAALDMAACLRDSIFEPEPPEPPDPPEPPEPPPPGPDRWADIVLAALLVRLREEGKTGRPLSQTPDRGEGAA